MRYRIIEKTGSAGRRRYKAVDSRAGFDGEFRAILDLPNSPSTRQHIRVLRRLRSPSLPRVVEAFRRNGRQWVVLEWINGPTLADYLSGMRSGRMPHISPVEAFRLWRRLAHNLHSIHRRSQVAHGDIKPGNLIVANDPSRLVLIDFGSAWLAERTTQREDGDGFHAAYAAPELQDKNRLVDWRCDVFSVGVVFYELLTLRLPYQLGGKAGRQRYATSMVSKYEPPSHQHADCRSIPRSVWKGIDRIAARSLAFDPDERYASPQAWLDDLDAVDFEIRRPSTLSSVNACWSRVVEWIAGRCGFPPAGC